MKDDYIRIRLSERDKETIRKAAEEAQMSMSEYIVSLVRDNEIRKETKRMRLYTADREAGNFIEEVKNIEEGMAKIAEYEESDKKNGTYTPNFYEVEDENHYRVEA